MARQQINLSLTDDTRDKLDMLVTLMRKTSGLETSRTTIITVLVEEAASRVESQAQPLKRIEPIRDGKKTIGWQAVYGDHIVGTFDLRDKDRAQSALDRFVYEELSR
jgi:hypothetical protein